MLTLIWIALLLFVVYLIYRSFKENKKIETPRCCDDEIDDFFESLIASQLVRQNDFDDNKPKTLKKKTTPKKVKKVAKKKVK